MRELTGDSLSIDILEYGTVLNLERPDITMRSAMSHSRGANRRKEGERRGQWRKVKIIEEERAGVVVNQEKKL